MTGTAVWGFLSQQCRSWAEVCLGVGYSPQVQFQPWENKNTFDQY